MVALSGVCDPGYTMCLALPHRIVRLLASGRAISEGPGGPREIDTSLVGKVTPGTFVLVAYGSAIDTISPDEAAELITIWKALEANEELEAPSRRADR
jgi:hydrogenase assembly chaperone HypC/HupF